MSFMCKRFINYPGKRGAQGQGYWIVLGVVHARSGLEARAAAIAQWGQVDSVYDLDGID
jgi:hypothetical protein